MPPSNFLLFGLGEEGRGNLEIASVSIFGPKRYVSQRLDDRVHMQEYPPFLPIRPSALVSASRPIAN